LSNKKIFCLRYNIEIISEKGFSIRKSFVIRISYGKFILPIGKLTLLIIAVANFISIKMNSSSAENTLGEIIHNTNKRIAIWNGFIILGKKGSYFQI
jgi:hypothetical protein